MLLFLTSCLGEVENVTSSAEIVQVGQQLPSFSVTMNNGARYSSNAENNGKPSVIIFFNTGCSDCRNELPVAQTLYNIYKSKVNIVCISRNEAVEPIAQYWRENNLSLPYSAQANDSIYKLFARRTIPRIYISCAEGTVRNVFVEKASKSQLTDCLSPLISPQNTYNITNQNKWSVAVVNQ